MSVSILSESGMTGGHLSGLTGSITSILSAIFLVFVTTISYALSYPRYENSSSISSVVRRYNGACMSASLNPLPAMSTRLYTSSSGSRKCTSHVATTGIPRLSPRLMIFLFISSRSLGLLMSSKLSSLIMNSLLPLGWISR